MAAYYNENDPFAADWLRELIRGQLIAEGEVDDRSITDVTPADLRRFAQCHFFAGISVWSHALRLAGWPDADLVWTGSCPCQPFSAAGQRKGFDDSRHLWPEWFSLIRECRPPVVFGEQVASKGGLAWLDLVYADLEGEGYALGAVDMCAAGFGAPHIRQRLYFVADAQGGRPERCGAGGEPHRQPARGGRSGDRSKKGCLAHATGPRRQGRRFKDAPGHNDEQPAELRDAGGLADAGCTQSGQRQRNGGQAQSHRNRAADRLSGRG
jgi:DNA (cytosine-5)-methyltransferase 1